MPLLAWAAAAAVAASPPLALATEPPPSVVQGATAAAGLTFVGFILAALKALVVLVVAWIVANWARFALERTLDRTRLDRTLVKFFANLGRWSILVLAVLVCLTFFGVDTTTAAAAIGAAGIAIGLAMQGSLSNVAAGIMLQIFRPFKVGDVITVAGQTGTVDEIDLFQTTLDTADNRRVILPNGSIFGNTIENITHHPTRRVDVAVGVDYASDIDRTRQVLLDAAKSVLGRLPEREPEVTLVQLGASSVDWAVRVWADRTVYGSVKEDLLRAVKMALDAANIGIPFPQMEVHLRRTDAPAP